MRVSVFASILAFLMMSSGGCTAEKNATNRQLLPPSSPLIWRIPKTMSHSPDLTRMSQDVRTGYLLWDSVSRNVDDGALQSILQRLETYDSDTVKLALKYWYLIVDYDPIQAFFWTGRMGGRTILEKLDSLFPISDRNVVKQLLLSDYIAHVRVTEVANSIDSGAAWARDAVLVTSMIIEPIKGQVLPGCIPTSTAGQLTYGTPISIEPTDSGDCLQWDYRLQWGRGRWRRGLGADSTLANGLFGEPWAIRNREFIVFLEYSNLTDDSSNTYVTLFSGVSGGQSSNAGMYPVIDGKVYDPYDDFGFGTGLTPEQFKDKLRRKIEEITGYQSDQIERRSK